MQTECTVDEALMIMQERAVIHRKTLAEIADAGCTACSLRAKTASS